MCKFQELELSEWLIITVQIYIFSDNEIEL